MLSDEMLQTLMLKKWATYARGHFVLNCLCYCAFLTAYALLCVQYRHDLANPAPDEPVLKPILWSSTVCRAVNDTMFPVAGTQTAAPGQGDFACDLRLVQNVSTRGGRREGRNASRAGTSFARA